MVLEGNNGKSKTKNNAHQQQSFLENLLAYILFLLICQLIISQKI